MGIDHYLAPEASLDEGNPGGEYLNVVPLQTFDSKTGLDVTHTIILPGDGFPDVLHAEHGSPIETVEVDAEAAHGTAEDPHPTVGTDDQVRDDAGGDASCRASESDESDYGDLHSEFRYEPREGDTTGAELEAEFFHPGPYYVAYPYDDSSTSQFPPYTRISGMIFMHHVSGF
ncbi:hypothetical protein CTI12_AA581380 [Artemisia annua]|uniref:Uncharacterized protein n=1 Tax=Artemisia annua TaxID=35608 RepID=A0A2U1KP39_ARTAN|nr:hypothetical protein CTI12_AA581380 [Artemisia annua]